LRHLRRAGHRDRHPVGTRPRRRRAGGRPPRGQGPVQQPDHRRPVRIGHRGLDRVRGRGGPGVAGLERPLKGLTMRVPARQIQQQLESVFTAWGMSDAHAETTAEMMVETDLRGVDSHGISMLPTYDKEFRAGRINMKPVFKTVREAPAMALIDADASLGHPVAAYAMNLAVDKCLKSGVAVVSVVNSHHFGAAGCYSKIAADRGVIGMVTSATRGVTMVPTFAAEPVMGTNPLAFA